MIHKKVARTASDGNQAECDRGREGVVLIVCALLIVAITFIAGTTAQTLRPEIRGARYYRNERRAFYNADAGVQYVIDRISEDIKNGAIDMELDVISVNYTAPEGYFFEPVTEIRRMPDEESFVFRVTADVDGARSSIEAAVQRGTILKQGAFGNALMQLQPNIEFYSYDSSVTTTPATADSTGEASSGSNEEIVVRPNVVLDGIFLLGKSPEGNRPDEVDGYENKLVDRMNPDPLGMEDGMLASAMEFYSDPANNDNESVGIEDNSINLGSHSSITLPGGRYYLENLSTGPHTEIIADGTFEDPVIIFSGGNIDIGSGCNITTSSGRPTDLLIFSSSSENIKINPNGNFHGLVYAPLAELEFQPNNALYGVFFANELTVRPGSASFFDTSLLSRLHAPYVELRQWRHLIE